MSEKACNNMVCHLAGMHVAGCAEYQPKSQPERSDAPCPVDRSASSDSAPAAPDQPAGAQQESAAEWISLKDRRPSHGQAVIARVPNGYEAVAEYRVNEVVCGSSIPISGFLRADAGWIWGVESWKPRLEMPSGEPYPPAALYATIADLEAERDRLREELAAAKQRIAELETAVLHSSGDNLCWLTTANPAGVQIPPREEFLESCRRFHAQISGENGELSGCKTIAQLEAEAVELRQRIAELEGRVNG